MPRYPITLRPQGAVPKNLDLGVRLVPLKPDVKVEVAPEVCVSECGGWGVTVDGDPQSGEFNALQNATPDPITIRVEHLGELCDGDCIEWDARNIMNGADVMGEVVLTPDGCSAVDIAITHSDTLAWQAVWFGLFARINGNPFCETVIFTTQTPSDPCDDAPIFDHWMQDIDPTGGAFNSGSTVDPYTGFLPNGFFNAYFAPSDVFNDTPYFETFCGQALSGTISSITGGDPDAYADFSIDSSGLSVPGVHLSANGAHDYSGITITIDVFLDGPFAGVFGTPISLTF